MSVDEISTESQNKSSDEPPKPFVLGGREFLSKADAIKTLVDKEKTHIQPRSVEGNPLPKRVNGRRNNWQCGACQGVYIGHPSYCPMCNYSPNAKDCIVVKSKSKSRFKLNKKQRKAIRDIVRHDPGDVPRNKPAILEANKFIKSLVDRIREKTEAGISANEIQDSLNLSDASFVWCVRIVALGEK